MTEVWDQFIATRFEVLGTSGTERVCRCPWHDDGGKPNLYVNAAKGLYLCHSCGAKGSLATLLDDGELLPAPSLDDLRTKLYKAQRTGKPALRPKPETTLDRYEDTMHNYWTKNRGFSHATIKSFGLRYDILTDCAIIPIRDPEGRLLGVIERRLDGSKPKYNHPSGFKAGGHLFAAWRARRHRRVALCEGPLDAVACWDAHVPAVAMHGARLAEDQAKILKQIGVYNVVIMTDNDDAGRNAIPQIHEALKGSGIQVEVAQYQPDWRAKDPGELDRRQRHTMFKDALNWRQYTMENR